MTIAFLTYAQLPHGTDDDRLVFDLLREQNITVQPVVWDDVDVDWPSFDTVIIRSCWDYFLRPHEFSTWLKQMQAWQIPVLNPPEIINWNIDKFYLQDLQKQDVALVPSVWLRQGQDADLAQILQAQDWPKAVVKPTISGTAYKTWLTSPTQAASHQPELRQLLSERNVLVQKFIPEIVSEGEWSLVFFKGQFSHAVLKQAQPGDFRVQDDFGGTFSAVTPSLEMIWAAQSILSPIQSSLLYARVDGVMIDGQFTLMELELIEPDLFLGTSTAAPLNFARAIVEFVVRPD